MTLSYRLSSEQKITSVNYDSYKQVPDDILFSSSIHFVCYGNIFLYFFHFFLCIFLSSAFPDVPDFGFYIYSYAIPKFTSASQLSQLWSLVVVIFLLPFMKKKSIFFYGESTLSKPRDCKYLCEYFHCSIWYLS